MTTLPDPSRNSVPDRMVGPSGIGETNVGKVLPLILSRVKPENGGGVVDDAVDGSWQASATTTARRDAF